jgi:two-component system, cell cycle sensor histidine kinase and response regulator CckA
MERADLEQWKAREVARLLGLVESERRYYQEIAACIPVGLLVLSPDLAIISANRAVRKIFGLTGSPLRARLDTLLPPSVLDRVTEVLKTSEPQINILVAEPKTGRRLRVGILAIHSWDDESSPEALVSIEDLKGLRDLEVPVRPISGPAAAGTELDNLSAVVWTLDLANTTFLSVTGYASRLLGYPVQHWTNNASFWTDRVQAADREWVLQSYQQAIQRGESHSTEFRAVAADGRVLWVRESAQLLTDAQGRPRYLTGVTFDVTERRLLQDQLLQSERVQAVSKLAGRMAHDLNNMLMIVTGHSEELLNSLPANSPLRTDVQEILNATERMSSLTGNLLAFTRRPSSTVADVDLHKVLRAVEQRLGLQFKLPARPPTQPHVVRADAERLEQIVTSLIQRERSVAIETSYLEIQEDFRQPGEPLRPGAYGVIAITLSGRAFDPDAKASWFEAVLTEKDAEDDWPSALTRAYGIVRQWGGDIAASAAPGAGTVLRMFLESAVEAVKSRPPTLEPAGAQPDLETILVVDDETAIRELVLKILRRHGYQVLEAANGEEALAVCREHFGRASGKAIDLLITDVMMPRMGGPELVDRLRQEGLNPKVLYVSGFTGDANISARNFPPGTAFLEKPFTLAALLERVQEVLKARF